MNNADLLALEQIRKAAGNAVSEPVWDMIEAEVVSKGIVGLSGTARIIVESVVRKHGGNSHNQNAHGGKGGGSSSSAGGDPAGSDAGPINRAPAGGASGKFGTPDYVKTDSISGKVYQRGQKPREVMSPEDRKLVTQTSRKQIEDAEGKGIQPPEGGRFLSEPSERGYRLSSHGAVMNQAEINGGSTPRVKTHTGGSATVKGFKNKNDVTDGDIIGVAGSGMKTTTYVVVGRSQKTGARGGTFEQLQVRSIGKNGKPTGQVVDIGLQELDSAVSILSPRQSR